MWTKTPLIKRVTAHRAPPVGTTRGRDKQMAATPAATRAARAAPPAPAHLAAEHDQAGVEHDADRGHPDRDPLREIIQEHGGRGGRGGRGGLRGHPHLDRLGGGRGKVRRGPRARGPRRRRLAAGTRRCRGA